MHSHREEEEEVAKEVEVAEVEGCDGGGGGKWLAAAEAVDERGRQRLVRATTTCLLPSSRLLDNKQSGGDRGRRRGVRGRVWLEERMRAWPSSSACDVARRAAAAPRASAARRPTAAAEANAPRRAARAP